MNITTLQHTNVNGPAKPASTGGSSIFRVDSFTCPAPHRAAFEDRLAIIHGYFDTLDGCLYNRVVVAQGESQDMVKIVTMVEWRDGQALNDAKTAVAAYYTKSGFDPGVFMAERGIVGDFGVYRPMER